MASLQQPRSTPFSFLPPCLFGGPAGRSGDGANSEQRQGPRQCVCLCFPKQTAARRRVWRLGVGATRPGAPPSDADAGQTCGRTATACREQLSHPPPPAGAVEEVRSRSVAGLTANSGTAGVTHSRADRAGSAPPLPPVPPQAAAPPVQDGMECEGPRRLGPSLGSEGHTDGAHPQTSPGATANSQQDASTTATGTR